LDVTAEVKENTHILFWQELTLIRGVQYQFPGAFAEIGGTISNFWCEILLGPGLDYKEPIWVGFHPWDGTLPGIDSTFQENYRKGPGSVSTAQGEIGQTFTVYSSLNVWLWTGGVPRTFEGVMDALILPRQLCFLSTKNSMCRLNFINTKRKWVSPLGDQKYARGNDRVQWIGPMPVIQKSLHAFILVPCKSEMKYKPDAWFF